MKNVEQQNIKKACNFYVSNLHLSIMLLPYICNEINKDVEVTTIFENLSKKDLESIANKINRKESKELLEVNWTNEDEITEKSINDKKSNTIIIEGSKKYIKEAHEKIENLIVNSKIQNELKIIDCYNVEEVSNEMKEIVKDYNDVINTSGEVLLKKLVD